MQAFNRHFGDLRLLLCLALLCVLCLGLALVFFCRWFFRPKAPSDQYLRQKIRDYQERQQQAEDKKEE